MKNIDWKRKLTSRKLWTAVASFVSMMIVATGGAENTATQVTALILSLIHISEPTRQAEISYAVFCLKKKKKNKTKR